MKGLKKIAGLFIALLLAVVITACSSTGGIETSLNVASRNNKLTLVANFTDENQRIFTDYTPYAYIYNMDGNNVADEYFTVIVNTNGSINLNPTSAQQPAVNVESTLHLEFKDGFEKTITIEIPIVVKP